MLAGAAGAGAACDVGTQHDEPHFGSGAPVHLVAANVGSGKPPLAVGARIELFFDRLLLQESVTRQSFELSDLNGNSPGTPPTLQYDPVARVVAIYPQTPLMACQSYKVTMVTPKDSTDANGIRAIDGATLAPSVSPTIEFPMQCATGDGGTDAGGGAPAPIPNVDFCGQIIPIIQSKCDGNTCHGGSLPAAGLRLDSPHAIAATAIGRVAQGANTGARSSAQPQSLLFGQDMPIVQPNAPGNSWMMYKLLLAVPQACSSSANAAACDASAPTVMDNVHTETWGDMSDSERATLTNLVQGREMPFPANPSLVDDAGHLLPGAAEPLTLDELELVSNWILQGAPVNACH
ncbi:MAG TPA: hypothetical protein VF765_28820 [Polyangiaceae bacterium]